MGSPATTTTMMMIETSNLVLTDVAFPGYVVSTNDTGSTFYAFVLVYTGVVFLLLAPIAAWRRRVLEKRSNQQQQMDLENMKNTKVGELNESRETMDSMTRVSNRPTSQRTGTRSHNNSHNNSYNNKRRGGKSKRSTVSSGLGLIGTDPDSNTDTDTTSRLSSSVVQGGSSPSVVSKSSCVSKTTTARFSAVNSAATTSRVYLRSSTTPTGKELPNRIWDNSRRRKHRRRSRSIPLQHSPWENTTAKSIMFSEGRSGRTNLPSLNNNTTTANSIDSAPNSNNKNIRKAKGLSDIASSTLGEQHNDRNPLALGRSSLIIRQQQCLRPSKRNSFSSANGKSVLSSIVDDITPNDAADADDPGLGNLFQDVTPPVHQPTRHGVENYISNPSLASALEGLLQLGEVCDEMKHVLSMAVPLTAAAMAEPLFKTLTVAFISNFIDSESMVAYLLVALFLRLTCQELSGAIIDALSSFIQACLYSGGEKGDAAFLAGQLVQLAIFMQLVLVIPLATFWTFYMGHVVRWLVQSDSIAKLAEDYTKVIVFGYVAHAISRTCTVVFHLCGHDQFETRIDICAGALTVIVVALVTGLVENASIHTVGYIQVLITVAFSFVKIAYPAVRGWIKPFRAGMIQNFALLQNRPAFWSLGKATLPLFVGTILEYGEWEWLTIFAHYLGPAEVVAWALLGCLWELLEASTEGIGEATSNRVSYFLAIAKPVQAKTLSYKVIYFAIMEACIITSIVFLAGKYFAIVITNDPTLQHLINNVLAMIGLANGTMSLAQILWTLCGAQGRYREAMCAMFVSRWVVTIPIAVISIFGFRLDLNAVSGSLVVGYASAACILAYHIILSDWEGLSEQMLQEEQDEFDPDDEEISSNSQDADDEENDDDNYDDDDDSFDDF